MPVPAVFSETVFLHDVGVQEWEVEKSMKPTKSVRFEGNGDHSDYSDDSGLYRELLDCEGQNEDCNGQNEECDASDKVFQLGEVEEVTVKLGCGWLRSRKRSKEASCFVRSQLKWVFLKPGLEKVMLVDILLPTSWYYSKHFTEEVKQDNNHMLKDTDSVTCLE